MWYDSDACEQCANEHMGSNIQTESKFANNKMENQNGITPS